MTPGNYKVSPTADNTPRHTAPPPDTLATSLPEAPPAPVPEESPAPVASAPSPLDVPETLSPAEQYLVDLKAADIDIDTARSIYDAVASKGFYEETIKVRNGRAVFRTRTYDDHLRIITMLELNKPTLTQSYAELVNRYNLTASLMSWNTTNFGSPENDEAFEAKLAKIRKLPGPVVTLLVRELAKFDKKINLVFADGSLENF
jgi:hypothetical protein